MIFLFAKFDFFFIWLGAFVMYSRSIDDKLTKQF